jgi:mono/diheme cytochrome c family protein
MIGRLVYIIVALLLLLLEQNASWGLPWSQDMMNAPSVKPQETVVEETPQSAVPTHGEEPIPIPANIGELFQAKVRAVSLVNPVDATADSIEKGKFFYETNCFPCHGKEGFGDGPVGKKFSPPPSNLTTDFVQKQPDGQLFLTITHGSIAMPFYRDALYPEERWHLINYVKGVLGRK